MYSCLKLFSSKIELLFLTDIMAVGLTLCCVYGKGALALVVIFNSILGRFSLLATGFVKIRIWYDS